MSFCKFVCIPFFSKLFTAIFNSDETASLDLKPNTSMTVSVGNWTSLAPRWIVLQLFCWCGN